ncbi:IS5 family transposase [Actinosynnema sp. NPDC053489]|uniref:IS5 family transposase n=1 Tax=Actinosynnema sp. NPDC053489 TaxID=3363916 RepID=UPI0037C75DA5
MSLRLVPDELWALAEPLIPRFRQRPQGGGTAPVDDRAVFTAIVYVLTSGCGWPELLTVPTAHRRFTRWTKAALWRRLHQAVLDELGSRGEVDWSRAILDAATVRAKKGRPETGPNPVDRGKPGSKIHIVSDRRGLPLAIGVSAANLHDSQALKPMLMAIPHIRSRRFRPAKLHADRAYDIDHLRRWLRHRGIIPRIARNGIDSSERLGRHRWVVERTISWLTGYRRLTIRYERHADNYCGLLTLAATLTCFKQLTKLAT